MNRLPSASSLAVLSAGVLAILTTASTACAVDAITLEIQPTGMDHGEVPLVVALPASPTPGRYTLQASGDGPLIPANVFVEGDRTFVGFVLPQAKKGEVQTFSLRPELHPELGPPGVQLRPEGVNISVDVGGMPLTRYVVDQGAKPIYFPVIGPTGKRITRAYPMETIEGEDQDHPHQRSLWFTHGKVNGIDFWAEAPGHGTIKEVERKAVVSGPGIGLIHTVDDWLGPDGKKVCEDTRIVRFYDTKAARLLDFDITIRATDGPVTFGETKEGAFGIRVASSMDVTRKEGKQTVRGTGKIVNADGVTDEDAWGKTSPWVDYSGQVDGETVGIAILNHPESTRWPTAWHVRPYGLFAANPFGGREFGQAESGDLTIPEGKAITFRYRLIFHKGDAQAAEIANAYRAYAEPPLVRIRTP